MSINYNEEDFETYYQQYVKRDNSGSPVEEVEDFWERMLKEAEE